MAFLVFATVHLSGVLRTTAIPAAAEDVFLVPSPPGVERVEEGRTFTFRSYLKENVGLATEERAPRLWLTTATRGTFKFAEALERRMREMNEEKAGGRRSRDHALVILCADRDCLDECKARSSFSCYGAFSSLFPSCFSSPSS